MSMITVQRILQPVHPVVADALQKGHVCFIARRSGEDVGIIICSTKELQGKQVLSIELLMADGDLIRKALLQQAVSLQHGLGLDALSLQLSGPAEIATYTRLGVHVQPISIIAYLTMQEEKKPDVVKRRKKRSDSTASEFTEPAPPEQGDDDDAVSPIPVEEGLSEPDARAMDIKPAPTVALSDNSRHPGRQGG
jgi:hypothetical protein